MSLTDQVTSQERITLSRGRLIVFAAITSLAAGLIAWFYPSGSLRGAASSLPVLFACGWIWSQAVLLVLPAWLLGAAVAGRRPKLGECLGGLLMLAVPLLVLCDAITFSWIGERFLSRNVWRLVTTLRESLVDHVSYGTVIFAACTITAFALISAVTWWIAGKMAARAMTRSRLVTGLLVGSAFALALPAVWQFGRTRSEMAQYSARHPLCAVGLIGYRGVGQRAEIQTLPMGGGLASTMESLIARRERGHLRLTVEPTDKLLRDVVIVIIESFRHELVDPNVMPTLSDLAQRGMHCRAHFSTGNATTDGMFGLLNGLEAIWYSRNMHSAPLLNRLFRSAGYEIGFFAGHNDWQKFRMDGFINRDQFDVFQTDHPNWLESDRRATQRAVNFLQHTSDDETAERKPRLAILYLYSTHADYHSYPQDRLFQPAADDRFVIPFSTDAVTEVWNRYKNSARSIDRFLSAVLDDDRIAMITGDHGESFLEDGVCGHGVRVSRYQNMTPAVIYCPGEFPRIVLEPTMHADLLPTLLSAVGLRLSDPASLDGIDLLSHSQQRLGRRLFVTRNYLSDDCALIGLSLGNACFGYRCAISLAEWKAEPLNPINDAGYEQTSPVDGEAYLKQWTVDRFPDAKHRGSHDPLSRK